MKEHLKLFANHSIIAPSLHQIHFLMLTLHAGLHHGTVFGHREGAAYVINLAHVCMEQLQAGGEGHPLQLCLLPLLLRQSFVPQSGRQMVATGQCECLSALSGLTKLPPQTRTVCGAANAGGQVPVTSHHL